MEHKIKSHYVADQSASPEVKGLTFHSCTCGKWKFTELHSYNAKDEFRKHTNAIESLKRATYGVN